MLAITTRGKPLKRLLQILARPPWTVQTETPCRRQSPLKQRLLPLSPPCPNKHLHPLHHYQVGYGITSEEFSNLLDTPVIDLVDNIKHLSSSQLRKLCCHYCISDKGDRLALVVKVLAAISYNKKDSQRM